MQTINKLNTTTLEVVETTAQIIVPEQITKTNYTLADLDKKKEKLVGEIARHTSYLPTPQAELDKINGDIAKVQVELDEVNTLLLEADKLGIIEKVEPITE